MSCKLYTSCVCPTHAACIRLSYFTATLGDIWTTFATSLRRVPRDATITKLPRTYPRRIPEDLPHFFTSEQPRWGGKLSSAPIYIRALPAPLSLQRVTARHGCGSAPRKRATITAKRLHRTERPRGGAPTDRRG